MHQLNDVPQGQSELLVCPRKIDDCSSLGPGMCHCLKFSFDASKPGHEEVEHPEGDFCPT